jgi:3-hydroxyisobutyrate dehydrogenase-like beta-hydroxyacid dehydrogenase
MDTIGIIGTGEIGWRMGKLLIAAGCQVIGYDIRPEALERPKQSGFIIANSVADLCKRADLVLSCVTDGTALRALVAGPSGLAANLAPGKPYIDTTSAEPWITINELDPLLKQKGIPFLDAPVSGGVPAAEAGRLNFMVGGDIALFNRCRTTLGLLGPVVTHVGGIGTGHTIKAINMLALAASMLSTSELLAIGIAAGHSLSELVERLEESEGASYSTRVHFPRFIAPGNYASGFTFDLMLKDLSIGIGLADRCGISLYLEKTTFEIYRAAADAGLNGKDNTRIVEHILAPALNKHPADAQPELMSRIGILAAACNTLIAAETICLGVAAGLSVKSVIKVISESSGDTRALSHGIADYLRNVGMAASLSAVHTAAVPTIAYANKAVIPVPLLTQMDTIYAATMDRFGDNSDSRMVLDLLAERTKQGDALKMMWETASGYS